jgi:hypothetical protein
MDQSGSAKKLPSTSTAFAAGARIRSRRTARTSIRALAIVLSCLTIASGAQARDLCFEIPNFFGITTLVGKGFRLPSRNKCKPFQGFTQGPIFALVTGTWTASCAFNLPPLVGACSGTLAIPGSDDDELFPVPSSASGGTCIGTVP